ncbi:MAG: DUF2007 domain-containing protein [Rubritalea sp.]|uniref:putative signal transducing protein n=1 Tax=Rubritalea sp. TaxID=2109375 RepID=UPI003241D0A0
MRKVYEDQDMTMVGYYQSLLEDEGIQTLVKNEYASLATGEIPFTQVYPELWVTDEADYERSVDLIRSVRDSQIDGEEEKASVGYKRSVRMQLILWPGMLMVLLLLVFVLSSVIEALF